MTYNYYEAVKNDIYAMLDEEHDYIYSKVRAFKNYEDAQDWLTVHLSNDDSVTGNASGSYTCNRWQAEENLLHNRDLILEAIDSGYLLNELDLEPEMIDVCVRVYMVDEIVHLKWDDICSRLGFEKSQWM